MKNIYCVRPKGFNIGNELIYLCARYFLKKFLEEPCNFINFPATKEYESQGKAGFTAATVWEFNNYADAVVVIGGNLFENGKLDIQLEAFKKLEVPLLVFSVSRGRVYSPKGQLIERTDSMPDTLIKTLCQRAVGVLARDEATHEYLKKIDCPSVLGGCPSLFLDEVIAENPLVKAQKGKTVFISVRTPELISLPAKRLAQVRTDIEGILALLRGRGESDVQILCHDHRDIPFAASFDGVEYSYTEDEIEFIRLLKQAKTMITYRLHSALPCLSIGTDFINVSYDERALSMFETIGYGSWNINMMELEEVVESVRERLDHLGELRALRKKNQKRFDALYEAMEKSILALNRSLRKTISSFPSLDGKG